jgi:uncharacterized membrane protein YjfL (UPF0719 family)
MMYNLTELTNADTFVEVVIYADNAAANLLFGGFIIVIFIVFLVAMSRNDFIDRIAVGSYVCFVLSLLATLSVHLNFLFLLGFLIIAAFSTMYLWFTK